MAEPLAPRWRRLISSLAYAALVALAAGLGYLTFRATTHRQAAPNAGDTLTESATTPLVELSGFSARREKSADAERLNVSVRLRLTAKATVDSFVYVVARNDHVSPKLWAVWPPQAVNALTTGGHFRGGTPPSGEPVALASGWTRLNATFQHPPGRPPFDTVTLYVVSAKGEIVLERPFAL